MAQKVQTWTGNAGTSTVWATAANWSQTGATFNPTGTTAIGAALVTVASTADLTTGDTVIGTGVPANTTITVNSATTFTMSANATIALSTTVNLTFRFVTAKTGAVPSSTDVAVLNSNLIDPPVITGSVTVRRFEISNTFGTTNGPTFTIPFGTTFICNSTVANFITVAGGNIVNNGTLSITNPTMGAIAGVGVSFLTPIQAPSSATDYGYSGSGLISFNLPAVTTANGGVFSTSCINAFSTIRLLFNGTNDFTLSATVGTYIIRHAGGLGSSPLVIGGAGLTHGTVGSPKTGGIFSFGSQSTTTVNAGTTLNMYSAGTNNTRGITAFGQSANALTFTNNGVINILGTSLASGIGFSTGTLASAIPFTFTNTGTINVDISTAPAQAALTISNGGGAGATGTLVTFTNSGILNLKNSATALGAGFPIFAQNAGEAPPMLIVNHGFIDLVGSTFSYGSKVSVTNNGTINTNSELKSFNVITNSATGIINFNKTAATATTKLVTFNGIPAATTSGSLGTTITEGGNTYAILIQKFTSGTSITAVVLSGVTPTASGTLARGTSAGTGTLSYTSVSVSPINGALSATTPANSGTINFGTASDLNIVSGLTTTSTSTLAPGGSTGKGILTYDATATLNGKLDIQVAGNTAAGVNYDQITNSATNGGFNISGATLDVTGISGTASPIDIIVASGSGAITTTFQSVIGLPNGWSVNYDTASTPDRVQLVYSAVSPTGKTWLGTSTVWTNSANWNPAGAPDQNSDVTIVTTDNQPVIASNVNINSLTITSGNLTVNSGFNLTVTGAVVNNGGTMTLANNANLIQGGTTNSNTGNITVNRNSNALSRLDFTLWSSPVTNASQFLTTFSPFTSQSPSRFYDYSETTNQYTIIASPTTTTFATGQGYLIRVPNDHTASTIWNGSFSGVPNNGTINKSIAYAGVNNGYNAIGNPYPSTIDAAAFIAANTANIESSLYFWRKVNAATGSAYAVYNPMGSTIATPSSALPNGTIQVGQGFFVKAKSASSVNFTNAMRVANTANQFFKTKEVAKDRLWLNLTATSGAFSQALIGYTADATSGVDIYDAKFINDSPVALTSSINSEEYSIQGRPTFDATDVVALNFKTDVAGDYSIALDHFDGVFAAAQDVYLVDNTTGAETNLKEGAYTFNAAIGTDNTRFSLKYQKTLKVIDAALDNNSVSVYQNNGAIYINSKSAAISSVRVFDVQGRLLAEQRNVKANTAVISNLRAKNQILLVKVVGEDNSEVSKKIMN